MQLIERIAFTLLIAALIAVLALIVLLLTSIEPSAAALLEDAALVRLPGSGVL